MLISINVIFNQSDASVTFHRHTWYRSVIQQTIHYGCICTRWGVVHIRPAFDLNVSAAKHYLCNNPNVMCILNTQFLSLCDLNLNNVSGYSFLFRCNQTKWTLFTLNQTVQVILYLLFHHNQQIQQQNTCKT